MPLQVEIRSHRAKPVDRQMLEDVVLDSRDIGCLHPILGGRAHKTLGRLLVLLALHIVPELRIDRTQLHQKVAVVPLETKFCPFGNIFKGVDMLKGDGIA